MHVFASNNKCMSGRETEENRKSNTLYLKNTQPAAAADLSLVSSGEKITQQLKNKLLTLSW